MDTSQRFAATYAILRPNASFLEGKSPLFLAAGLLALDPGPATQPHPSGAPLVDGSAYTRAVQTLRKSPGWTHPARGFLRYPLAALCLRKEIDPSDLHTAYLNFRTLARKHKLPRASTTWLLLAATLHFTEHRQLFEDHQAAHLKQLYKSWKRQHSFLTSATALPLALLHSLHHDAPTSTQRLELAYLTLKRLKSSHQSDRYCAAQILSLLPQTDPAELATRLDQLHTAARANKLRAHTLLTHLAVPACLPLPPQAVADRIAHLRDELRSHTKGLPKATATAVAIALTSEEAVRSLSTQDLPPATLALLPHLQSLIVAQQAATTAAIIASSSAAAAAG